MKEEKEEDHMPIIHPKKRGGRFVFEGRNLTSIILHTIKAPVNTLFP